MNISNTSIYSSKSEGEWVEHEVDYVIAIHTDEDINPNPNEVSEYKWLSKDDLNIFCKNNLNSIAPWL